MFSQQLKDVERNYKGRIALCLGLWLDLGLQTRLKLHIAIKSRLAITLNYRSFTTSSATETCTMKGRQKDC